MHQTSVFSSVIFLHREI